jgi:hypothetical protein
VADSNSGLQIIDVSDPSNPIFAGSYLTLYAAQCVFVSGSYAYVGDWVLYVSSLQIIDVSDPSNPTYAGSYDTQASAADVFVSGGYAYVSEILTYSDDFEIIDVSDPSNPTFAGSYSTGHAKGVFVAGDFTYVASWNSLMILQFNPPAVIEVNLTPYNPPIIIPAGGGTFDFNIVVENNTNEPQDFDLWTVIHLPEVGEVEVLNVPDITIPAATALDRDRTQQVPDFAPAGTYTYYAYVGEHPWIVDHYDSFTFEKAGMDQSGSLGLPHDWPCAGEGFETLVTEAEIEVSDDLALLGNYPNPFNPTTTISFSLPDAGKVNLSVFDISGRLVAMLANGWRDAGYHEVTFDASDLALGIYFYRIEAGDFSDVKKMVLVK